MQGVPMARTRPGVLIRHNTDTVEREASTYLHHDLTTLGRSDMCTVTIPLATVSRLHAHIELQHDRYVLFDTGSANGTFVNGKRIDQPHPLRSDDEIWLGSSEATLVFTDPEATLILPSNVAVPLFIDEPAYAVQVYGSSVTLSPLEHALLVHLAKNPGTVCTRESCFLAAWGEPYEHATCEDALNNCVARLRRHLRAVTDQNAQPPILISTIPRAGFRLDADVIFAPSATPSS
jgi:DNA-binding winged helix-turn-helix (wHTH) protein